MEKLTITATDGAGTFGAFLARAEQSPAGVVVLIQEIFGVNDSMKETARQVADWGFHVLAPDLFWRLQPGVNLTDKSDAEWKQALDLMNRFDQAKGVEDLKATLAFARTIEGSNGRAGTMGYCLGGRLAAMMALDSDADVNVSYYGVGLDSLIPGFDRVRAPLILHIADEDKFFPAEGRAKVVAAAQGRPNLHAYVYPKADHAFARVGGTHWQGRAAVIANGRSAEALAAALG
jgi:carboxymethylenebutenolidase